MRKNECFFEKMLKEKMIYAIFPMTFTFHINMYSIEMQTFLRESLQKLHLNIFWKKRNKGRPSFSHFELVMAKVIACQSVLHATFSAESWSSKKIVA